jgi:hypothetical protein
VAGVLDGVASAAGVGSAVGSVDEEGARVGAFEHAATAAATTSVKARSAAMEPIQIREIRPFDALRTRECRAERGSWRRRPDSNR